MSDFAAARQTAWSLATQGKQVAMVRGWGFSKR
jgi:hypothetical protein